MSIWSSNSKWLPQQLYTSRGFMQEILWNALTLSFLLQHASCLLQKWKSLVWSQITVSLLLVSQLVSINIQTFSKHFYHQGKVYIHTIFPLFSYSEVKIWICLPSRVPISGKSYSGVWILSTRKHGLLPCENSFHGHIFALKKINIIIKFNWYKIGGLSAIQTPGAVCPGLWARRSNPASILEDSQR